MAFNLPPVMDGCVVRRFNYQDRHGGWVCPVPLLVGAARSGAAAALETGGPTPTERNKARVRISPRVFFDLRCAEKPCVGIFFSRFIQSAHPTDRGETTAARHPLFKLKRRSWLPPAGPSLHHPLRLADNLAPDLRERSGRAGGSSRPQPPASRYPQEHASLSPSASPR